VLDLPALISIDVLLLPDGAHSVPERGGLRTQDGANRGHSSLLQILPHHLGAYWDRMYDVDGARRVFLMEIYHHLFIC